MKPVEMREIEPGVFVAKSVARAKARAYWLRDTAENFGIVAAILCIDLAIQGSNSAGPVIFSAIEALVK